MQAPPPTAQRAVRRSPAADPGPPPNVLARTISPGTVSQSQSRVSTSSAKSAMNGSSRSRTGGQSSRDQNQPPLSQIEKSVTHLLVATKQLLETLTQWSRLQATDAQVSDVYVRLGYEFNIACRAFTAINVDVSDLGNVPELLRDILESTLSQEASQESLEKYLPKIRDIIITLLHGLKRKQQKLRQKNSSTRENGEASLPRNSSVSSAGSNSTGLTTLLDQGMNNQYMSDDQGDDRRSTMSSGTGVPPRGSSASLARKPMPTRDQSQSRGSVNSDGSSLSSGTMQSIPVLPPYPEEEITPKRPSGDADVDNFPPPPLPPKQQSALLALSRGGDLERRASRRLSAYHITKMIGSSGNLVPMPPTQNSPIPNRGRNDVKSYQNRVEPRRQQSTRLAVDTSPSRKGRPTEGLNAPVFPAPAEPPADDSPLAKTPEDKKRQPVHELDAPSATLQGPPSDTLQMRSNGIAELPSEPREKDTAEFPQVARRQEPTSSYSQPGPPSKGDGQFTPEFSPPPGKDLTLFLKYKNKVKKFVLVGGYTELSISRLQLAFIEKFSWNTHSNGVDLPEIYIQEPLSGISHELEDLNDVKENSMLVLNVEVLDEVKRHIDQSMGGLKELVEGVKSAVDDQRITIQRVSDRQQDTSKELARIQAAPPGGSRFTPSAARSPTKLSSQSKDKDVSEIRRDIAVIRQTWNSYGTEVQKQLNVVKGSLAAAKRQSSSKGLPPDIKDSGRAYIAKGRAEFEATGDQLVADVDDLQDMVEDLRKDVVTRGVRPLPRQLEEVTKDVTHCDRGVKKLADLVKHEKPIWSKIWAKELDRICKEREILTQFEEIVSDLTDDLEKASQTFMLVEQATKEQMKDPAASGATAGRALSRGLNTTADPAAAKEGVLDEVRALQPNHENRLEAIERAEKMRLKELESRRGGEFQKELGNFVEEGKLKKSGGFEEVERARKAKDEKIRREVWERQNGMTAADGAAEPEPAAASAPAGGDDQPGDV